MFSDLCTHRPSPGCALWHSPAKTHKTNFNITCSQHIRIPVLPDIFLSLVSLLSRYQLKDLTYYFLCLICSRLEVPFRSCSCEIVFLQLEVDECCAVNNYIGECLKKGCYNIDWCVECHSNYIPMLQCLAQNLDKKSKAK